MKRIDTPTAVAIWGPDLGFDDLAGVAGTELDASWFNAQQEAGCRPLEQQSIVLDGANFDQWTDMLQSYRYLAGGMPTIESGAQMRVLTGGFFTVATGATFTVDSGGIFVLSDGSTVSLLGDLTLGTDSSNTLAVNSSITTILLANLGITGATGGNPVPLPEGATLAASKSFVGAASSLVDVEIVEQTTQRFDDSVSTLPPNERDMHWLETKQAVRMPDGGSGTVRAVSIPAQGNDVAFTTAAAIADTAAAATIRAVETEPLLITVKFGYQHTAGAATGLMSTRLEIAGPTDQEVFLETWRLVSSDGWLPFSQDYIWTPTDTFITPGTRNYVVLLRAGSNLGANLELRNIVVQVRSAFVV